MELMIFERNLLLLGQFPGSILIFGRVWIVLSELKQLTSLNVPEIARKFPSQWKSLAMMIETTVLLLLSSDMEDLLVKK